MTRVEERERVIVRFAGDSGDGMQLAGGRFTDATAALGNDLATLPDFPAEIRAPAGTLAGVSAFQIHFAARDILTPGDKPTTLVAMNPAALRSNISELEPGGTLIVNEEAFTVRNLQKAGYTTNPLEDNSLERYQLKRIPMLSLTQRAVEGMEGVGSRDAQRARNLFALGLVCWLYDRPDRGGRGVDRGQVRGRAAVMEANRAAFRAGYAFGDTTEQIDVRYHVAPATDIAPGTYRTVNGNTATALGLIAAAQRSGLQLMLSSYPITPASELLHELARHAKHGVRTVQAEDEIAAAGIALGAAFGGALGVTATERPGDGPQGRDDRSRRRARAADDRDRRPAAGPSTGMPTKTEQSDLLMALHGRHGESPLPIVAPATPGRLLRHRSTRPCGSRSATARR
jgi:2-oxoglutarate ferredoxin oxidoreductase subunit alpha